MNPWLEWGVPIITWFQSLGEWLIGPMKFFTFLGEKEFFLLFVPTILWCFDVSLGFRLVLMYLTSSSINGVLKLVFGFPRPYWVNTQIKAYKAANGFGLPSGHAQSSLAVWGLLAARIRRGWVYVTLGLLIFLISLSRIFLAVHFPTDTLVGWFVGGLILWGFLSFERPLTERLQRLSVGRQILLALLASLVLLAVALGASAATAARPVPVTWISTSHSAFPEAEPINPRDLGDFVAAAGTLLGVGTGGALLFSWGGFNAGGSWGKRALRYGVGAIGIFAIYFGLKLVFPAGVSFLAHSLRYLRYALLGFWAAYLGPRIFVAFRLA